MKRKRPSVSGTPTSSQGDVAGGDASPLVPAGRGALIDLLVASDGLSFGYFSQMSAGQFTTLQEDARTQRAQRAQMTRAPVHVILRQHQLHVQLGG